MTSSTQPLIFLDLDDVLCLNAPYGGHHVFTEPRPKDLWTKLFSMEAKETLIKVIREHRPNVVLTTSWLRYMDRGGFEALFRETGLTLVADCLHERWDAPQNKGMSRLHAIESWLAKHHCGEQFVVIDDHLSGTGLSGSRIDKARRVVLCEINTGLLAIHASAIHKALRS